MRLRNEREFCRARERLDASFFTERLTLVIEEHGVYKLYRPAGSGVFRSFGACVVCVDARLEVAADARVEGVVIAAYDVHPIRSCFGHLLCA